MAKQAIKRVIYEGAARDCDDIGFGQEIRGVSLGFLVATVLFAGLREVIDHAPISKSFKGQPITFIAASLMSLAFLGFKGLFGL